MEFNDRRSLFAVHTRAGVPPPPTPSDRSKYYPSLEHSDGFRIMMHRARSSISGYASKLRVMDQHHHVMITMELLEEAAPEERQQALSAMKPFVGPLVQSILSEFRVGDEEQTTAPQGAVLQWQELCGLLEQLPMQSAASTLEGLPSREGMQTQIEQQRIQIEQQRIQIEEQQAQIKALERAVLDAERRCRESDAATQSELPQIGKSQIGESRIGESRAGAETRALREVRRRNARERKDEECAVCFEPTPAASRYVTPCAHWTCVGCMRSHHAARTAMGESWGCPLCRAGLGEWRPPYELASTEELCPRDAHARAAGSHAGQRPSEQSQHGGQTVAQEEGQGLPAVSVVPQRDLLSEDVDAFVLERLHPDCHRSPRISDRACACAFAFALVLAIFAVVFADAAYLSVRSQLRV